MTFVTKAAMEEGLFQIIGEIKRGRSPIGPDDLKLTLENLFRLPKPSNWRLLMCGRRS
jgi:hypothetical protein